jgi:serine/threonine protein kinase
MVGMTGRVTKTAAMPRKMHPVGPPPGGLLVALTQVALPSTPLPAMRSRFYPHAEPIAGYKLLELIGRGGFGEVWKAEAPGGVLKAVKCVQGTLRSGVGDEVAVCQELKSLNAIKKVRHPYILSLDRYDIVDGQLIIIMELADCNLWQRFLSCQGRQLPGIPRAELLCYMAEAAEALDLMNLEHHLQHCDIKPQNMFLVHHHIKIADFGLVKDLEELRAIGNFCISPLYAAPETFDGNASATSDQYSLAIVYQELLTGRRPFDGKNPRQLMFQHVQQAPDLLTLPPEDQAVVQRALAKLPQQRFASCTELVKALARNSGAVPAPAQSPGKANPLPAEARDAAAGYLVERGLCQARCPACGFTGQLPNRFKGLRIRCRQCRQAFVAGGTQLSSGAPTVGPTSTLTKPASAAPA